MNGIQKNAAIRKIVKNKYITRINAVRSCFDFTLKQLAEVSGINYASFRKGLCDSAFLSAYKLEQACNLIEAYIFKTYENDSRMKMYKMMHSAIMEETINEL